MDHEMTAGTASFTTRAPAAAEGKPRAPGAPPAGGEKHARERIEAGLRKAAVFLLALDEESAAEVFKRLSDGEARALSREIVRLGIVGRDQIAGVMSEFQGLVEVLDFLRSGGREQAERLLRRSFPEETAERIIQKLTDDDRELPFGFLKQTTPEALFLSLQEEQPQTIAVVLSHLEPSRAAAILGKFSGERQIEVIRRIASLEETSREAVEQVVGALRKYFEGFAPETFGQVDGVRKTVEILGATDWATEKGILEQLDQEDPELAGRLKKLLFVFDDLLRVDDRGIQAVLKEIENKQLALALKAASPEVQEKIFRNMSQRAAEMVREEMDYIGPVRLAAVESAQQAIIEVVRRLEEAGELIIAGRAQEGAYLV